MLKVITKVIEVFEIIVEKKKINIISSDLKLGGFPLGKFG